MGVPDFSSGPDSRISANSPVDPRLAPTPDYGTLGPGSDVAYGTDPIKRTPQRQSVAGPVVAMLIGIAVAILFGTSHAPGMLPALTNLFSSQPSGPATSKEFRQLDRMKPQKQAETLLELAVRNNTGASEQISARVARWHGQVQWTPQLASLSTAALNSRDMRVRESGIEVELAAYGLSKDSESMEYLLKTASSPDHSQKIWALWALGLMANQGVASDRALSALMDHLQDSDEDSRRWAVEGLAVSGADQAVAPLLKSMHDDASPVVREAAACGIAEAGLFSAEARAAAVPQLLSYAEDAALDAQTKGWAFQALRDITHQSLPNDAAAWRKWYESTRND